MADLYHDNVDHVVLTQYNNHQHLAIVNLRKVRDVVRWHNTSFLDDHGNVLPRFRINRGSLTG